eukprot:s985_g15.t1
MDLRNAVGWDETDDLSLLVVLRQHVGRQLRLIHDRWSSYQLQLSFEKQADMMNGFLTQFVRSGANFLKRILRQDKVNDRDFLNVVESGNIFTQPCSFCSSYKKWEAHALDRELEHWVEEEKRLKELEDGTSKVRPLQPLSPFAKWDESRLDFTEREMADEVLKGLKAAARFGGFWGWDWQVSLMVIESLKHFARLGGALFLAEKMSSDHVVEIMKFVGLSLDSAESDLIAVADFAQAGWSNLRRGDHQSHWSNTAPVDNVRAALHVKTDMVKMARDARETVKLVQAEATKAEKVEASDVEEKLESELKFHLQLWQLISKHFEKTARKGEEKQQKSRASGEPEDPNDKVKLQAWLHFGNGWGIIDASNRSLGDGDLQALVRTAMICKAHGHPLRELNLRGNKLTDAGLKEVLALLRQDCEVQQVAGSPREEESPRVSSMLESLSIACNSQLYFRDRLLVESLPRSVASLTSLTTLDISFAPLNGKVVMSLAKALAESCRTLRSLSLAGCGLGSCGQADCVAVAALLGRAAAEAGFPGLERADLSGNFFGAAGLQWLTFANNGNPPSDGSDKVEIPLCRHFLRMSDGETEKEREALALHSRQNPLQLFLEGLLVNDTLEELDLSNCGVGIDTAWVLQEALAGHTKLQTLRLCENPLGEAGLRHILRLLTEMGDALSGIDLFGHREADIRCPPVKYRHAHPAGNYKLDMSLVADRAILRTLLRHVGSKYSDAPQRHLRFDPKGARPTERDPRGFWLVPCFGTCNVMYMPPLSEASHRRAKEAEAEQLREAETSEGGPRKSLQARGSFAGSNRRLGSFDSGDDAPRKSRVRVSPMSYGTGHHGSLRLLPMTKEKTQVEEKPQIQPGLPGTPEGDWIEVHELLQESFRKDCRVKVNSARFQLIKQAFLTSERFRFARALAKELWCNEELATELVCLLFPCIRSRKHQLALLQQLEPAKGKKVGDLLRGLLWFQDANPTGYNLDLSAPPDYALAEACLLVNAWESESARCAGRPDLSQSGNGEMIRNEDWRLPSRGWLRFDYSSTRRPPPDATSTTEVSEITRLLRNKDLCKRWVPYGASIFHAEQELSSRSRLEALRAASVHIFISSNQCRALVQCFPAAVECSSPEAINSGLDESPDRQEALCILHTRVVDRERMLGPEVLYSPVVVSQIGMTNSGGAVRVRGGMFKTGDLEMKTAEVQLPPVAQGSDGFAIDFDTGRVLQKSTIGDWCLVHACEASALDGGHSQNSAEERRDQNFKLAHDPNSAYFNFLIVFKEQDVLVLYRRLGVLHLLNPYKPEVLRMPVNLDISEQHRVVDFLVQLATLETGSRVLCWLDGTQVCVPASWGDKGVPRTNALLTVSYEGHNSSFASRQALADQFCIGFWSNLQKA